MLNIGKQVEYWRNGAMEDWEVGKDLIGRNRFRHGLFFLHLALEKILKAHVCRNTDNIAPPIHNLVRLAEKAGLGLTQEQQNLLAEANEFNIEGRYPELLLPVPTQEEVNNFMVRAEEIFKWLIKQLDHQ
ncbi:MAG: HEPN domain-containing protein [Nitrospirae bacterium]|nr:HEPN domain-containing protein [Nitrospirota bacterium]